MRKSVKAMVSWIATLSLLLGLFSVSAITTSAARISIKTRAEAVAWLNSQNNATYDFNGANGTQCVEFVKAYVNWLINGNAWSDCWASTGWGGATGDGHTIWQNPIWKEFGWTVYPNTADFMPQPGDIFSAGNGTYSHTGVVISSDLSTAVIADANARNSEWSDGDPVLIHNVTWRSAGTASAYGVNYFIRPNFSNNSISYSSIDQGTYFIKNHATGLYLDVDSAQDADKINIQVYAFNGTPAQEFSVTSASDGYKMRPLCSSSRYVNPYADTVVSGKNVNLYHDTNESSQWWKFEKVSGGYIIHNAQNPSVVLDVDSSHNVYVNTRSGVASQVWALQTQISYNANGGSGAPSSQFKEHGSTLTLSSSVPTREGYDFLGWSTNANATSAQYAAGGSFTSNANTTLYAVWKYKTYSVNYNANGGNNAPSSQTKTHGSTLTLSSTVPTRSGYNFLGWSTSSNATSASYQPGGAYTSNSSITLYAVWQIKTYQVYYDANGGSGAPSSQTKVHDTTLTLSSSVPTREGYIFIGWSTNPDTTIAEYTAGSSYISNTSVTLYAVWQNVAKELELNSWDYAFVSTEEQMCYYTYTPTISGEYVIYSQGYEDTKVYLYDANGNELMSDDDSGKATNFRLQYFLTAGETYIYGVRFYSSSQTGMIEFAFGDVHAVYTVTYDANGGVGAPSNQTKYFGEDLTLSSEIPTRKGYTFVRWVNGISTVTAFYQPGELYTSNENSTLYAVWQKNELMGDIVADDTLNTFDALILFAAASGQGELTDAQRAVADMNGDGTINMFDALVLFKQVSGQ